MSRKTHIPQDEASIQESIRKDTRIILSDQMTKFLEAEVVRLNIKLDKEGKKDKMTVQRLIRALITAYFEKRVVGLLVNPDD
ncbi:hypothetical protein UFOVP276_31 [uncultured Caudovirales phage]|uniref:Uncharacterized protein n=1 Tax=uncultured Caudovirales phage TaxID=2100421 RepID=A0A6J5LK91_9CAUD|nr:hypothetical protein UFOVP127_168 [uncultured Caudovirales phage]CAB4134924.1 hypothetical protein UFOVP276_31 [uncultured Caudovirales phage]